MAQKKIKWKYKLGTPISRKEAEELYTLWKELGTYAAVQRATGRSDSAIRHHVGILKAEEKTTIIVNQREVLTRREIHGF